MLKKELHEFLIANGGKFRDETFLKRHIYIIKNLWIYVPFNGEILSFDDNTQKLKNICQLSDLTLDILKQTLINAGISYKHETSFYIDQHVATDKISHLRDDKYPIDLLHVYLRSWKNPFGNLRESDKPLKCKHNLSIIQSCNKDGTFHTKCNQCGKEFGKVDNPINKLHHKHIPKPNKIKFDYNDKVKNVSISKDNIGIIKHIGDVGVGVVTENNNYERWHKSDIELIKESKQMESKTAKWQIDDGSVIEITLSNDRLFNEDYSNVKHMVRTLYPLTYFVMGPDEFLRNQDKSFNVFFTKDGTVKHAKYMPEDEFKIGDVVETDDGVGEIVFINDNKYDDTPFSILHINRDERECYSQDELILISSFEDWCKENLPENITFEFVNTPGNPHFAFFYQSWRIAIIFCDWSLINQIKVTQAIIEALSNTKDNT